MLPWQCAFPLCKESLNPQTWVEHPHDTLKFLLGIQLLLGTPRYTWGNGAHGMLRAADVAVMLLWCLWPMRVVLPGGLTLCQSISTRTILHRVLPPSGQFHCRDTRQNWLFGASSNWLCPAAARPPQESWSNRRGPAPAAFREKSSEGDGTVKRVLVNWSSNAWHWAKAVSKTTAPLAPLEPDWKHLRTAVVTWATCGLLLGHLSDRLRWTMHLT